MDKSVFEKYIRAGEIAATVREESKKMVKVGAKILDIAEKIESMIREMGGRPAFPVNISINEIAAHYTPTKNDETKIKKGDVIKIDIGVHIDGYIGDTAYTISLNKKYEKLVEASKKALEEAVKLCKPNALLSDVCKKIEETIRSFGFNPISNLTGHGLEQYDLHAEPQIPNVKINSAYKLKENQVIAIEPFATNGSGYVKDSDTVLIFGLARVGPTRNLDARKILSFAKELNGLPFAERWLPIDSVIKTKLALRDLRMRNLIYDYPVLKEIGNGIVSQAEHTVIVKDEPIITTQKKI